MQIFDIISKKYSPVDMETLNKIEQMNYQKAANYKINWYKRAQEDSIEIELLCANAAILGEKEAKQLYSNYVKLKKSFPNIVKLQRSQEKYIEGYDPSKEPITWVDNINDYWECSLIVSAQYYDDWEKWLKDRDFKIDITHKNGEEI